MKSTPLNPCWKTVASSLTSQRLRTQSHDIEEYQMIGDSLTSKYLNLKMQFRFPQGTEIKLPTQLTLVVNKMIEDPCRLYLVTGYVTKEWGLPLEPMNAANPLTSAQATQLNLQEYITSQLKPYFDDSFDKLSFLHGIAEVNGLVAFMGSSGRPHSLVT